MYNQIVDIIKSIEFVLYYKKIEYNLYFDKNINIILPSNCKNNLQLIDEIMSISKIEIKIKFEYNK